MNDQNPQPNIPFQDFHSPYVELKDELDEAYQRFMKSGWYVLGKEVAGFEEEYATYCDAEHCVGVGHGLDALRLAVHACDIGPGDEVIVPTNTYIATWLAVSQAGAKIVPVEPDPDTFNLDPHRIEEALTKQTRAILSVNLYGQACDYDRILEIARDRKIKMIVDNAQGHGAFYNGRRVGGIADIECHSFYPSKNLGAFGEAGAITTNDPVIADRIRTLRNYGSRVRYENDEVGYNSRLDELQAAFLRVKLRHLDEWTQRRRDVAAGYLSGLEGFIDLVLPLVGESSEHVWHLFVVRHSRRNDFRETLTQLGIQTLIHYPIPPHRSKAYQDLGFSEGSFPIAERLANEVLSLPMSPFIAVSDVAKICERIKAVS